MTLRQYTRLRRITGIMIFLLALVLYALTAEPTVSYWDCPEYVTTAARLEPGHPPGNPVWTLTARIFTLFAPDAGTQAYLVNLMSGVCSAIAVLILFLTLNILIRRLLIQSDQTVPSRWQAAAIIGGSACGAAVLAVSDTFWFSAVEAEVYAMSVMLTALVIWLTFLWGEKRSTPGASRYIVLTAYITGLAIGVHQLNLLVLPCIALIILFYRHDDIPKGIFAAAIGGSVFIIAAILFALIPGVLSGASALELLCVNTFGWPLHSGVLAYTFITLAVLIAAIAMTYTRHTTATIAVCAVALWLSGILSFGGNIIIGAVLSALAAAICLLRRRHLHPSALNLTMWCIALLFTGYCSYGLILIRGAARPPMNQGAPSDIFALTSYLNREQYGATPLLYGPTCYSTPMFIEELHEDPAGHVTASYTKYYRTPGHPSYAPVRNAAGRTVYAVTSTNDRLQYTPELNMWFPRLHSSDPDDIDAYRGWTGMEPSTMDSIETSYAVDSLGNPVGKFDNATGKRTKEKKPRPTYLQNFMMLGGYQMSYMYFRYLLWNFSGRQNEVYGQGEADAGNFITGIPPLDRIMLQHPELMPREIGNDNPGHHNYLMLPLLLGIFGISFQLAAGRRGRRQFAMVTLFFILTGIAIVIYLNQTPGQPRERDYSFVGSFYAFCIWIGLGGAALIDEARTLWTRTSRHGWWRRPAAAALMALPVGVPVMMAIENFPDHNRSHRTATRDFALNIITPLPEDAILFVNGDNFTFPLWYLQETEGIRRDVRIINQAYLATPWYAIQLAMATDGGPGLRLSIPAEKLNHVDLARYSVVDIGRGTADAVTALRRLFAGSVPEGKRPRLDADALRFPIPGSTDSLTINLHDVTPHGYLRLSQLVMLDVVAENAGIRPIFWHDAVSTTLPLGTNLHTEGLNRRFGTIPTQDTLALNARIILDTFRNGGLDRGVYVDVPGRQQVAIQRHHITHLAMDLIRRGAPGDLMRADSLAVMSMRMFPPESVPYTSYTDRGTPYSDAIELAGIYTGLWQATGKAHYRDKALRLINGEILRSRDYRRYLNSLTPRYRTYTKATTRLSARSDSAAKALRRILDTPRADAK